MRRILDKRPYIVLPDAGLSLVTHGYVANLAHAVLLAVDKPEASAGEIYNCGDENQLTLNQVVEVVANKMGAPLPVESMPWEIAHPARPYTNCPSTHHRMLDLSKLKQQLGYRDVHSSIDALGLTVDWLLENRPTAGGEVEERMQDSFDYESEDRLISTWHECLDKMRAVPFDVVTERPHPYAHPKKPGEKDHRNR